jgi:hypothetical protein
VTLRLHGVHIPLETARTAPDGYLLYEDDNTRVCRWRVETCKKVAPNPRCRCSHSKTQHSNGVGQCWLAACGCAMYRPRAEGGAA